MLIDSISIGMPNVVTEPSKEFGEDLDSGT